MIEEYNFKSICDITTRVMKLPKDCLSLKTRERPLQAARSVAAYIGRTEELIPPKIIAKVLNKNRTVIYHYEHSHKKNYANCEIYRDTFNKVYKSYKSIDGDKDIFLDGDFMKSYLLKNGVKESKVPKHSEVLLEVNSGQVKCIIKTSYFEFSNQLEIINFTLKNYHYTVKII
tara:strand:+ start:26 stop:544 length:519 start_codon:yes stop_codon:yes gene_type:complete